MKPADINAITAVLQGYPDLRIAIVFGSVAKGTANYYSDLDLAIALPKPLTSEEKLAMIAALADALGRPVDLIDLQVVGEPLLGQILTTGKRLMGENRYFAELLTKHVFNQADFLPYRNRIIKQRRQAWIGQSSNKN